MPRFLMLACAAVLLAMAPAVLAQVGTPGTSLSTPVGNVPLSTNVVEQLDVSTTVKQIKEALTADDIPAARNAYNQNTLLRGYGAGNGLSGTVFDEFKSYYRFADFNDAYITDAFASQEAAARAEKVEKTAMDAIPAQAIWSFLSSPTSDSFSAAAALYIGRREEQSSPYDRAIKRALNYGTTVNAANGATDAVANENIINALNSPSAASAATITQNLQVIYTQAAIRYAWLLGQDLQANPPLSTTDHRAEGQAFYRIVAPFVANQDPTCDSFMTALFDTSGSFPSGPESYYCMALQCIPPTMSITPAMLGSLENTDPCPGPSGVAFNTPFGDFTPQSTVTDYALVSVTAGLVGMLASDGEFSDAQTVYNSDATLTGLASTDASAYLTRAFGNTYQEEERVEMIEKTVQDAIPVNGIRTRLSQGASGNRRAWDEAFALYFGINNEASIYGRAIKRASNYGTTVDGRDAEANERAIQAFQSPSSGSADTINKAINTIYTQCALRYARLLDVDLGSTPQLPTGDHRAEGQAFYNIISQQVRSSNAACDNTLTAIFNVDGSFPTGEGRYYCEALDCLPSALGISSSELGTLENTNGVCDGSGFVPSSPPSPDAATALAASHKMVAVMAAAAVLLLLL